MDEMDRDFCYSPCSPFRPFRPFLSILCPFPPLLQMPNCYKAKENYKVRSHMKVIIVGAGFSGMSAAHHLVKNQNIHVTLIDKNNYSKFTPLLYQVATS